MLNQIYATQVNAFLRCSKRKNLEEKNSFNRISLIETNKSADIGSMYHYVLENVIDNSEVNNDLIRKFIIKFITTNDTSLDTSFLNTIEGRNAVFNIKNIFSIVKDIDQIETYELETEKLIIGKNIIGKIDLLLTKEQSAIIIDYKTGSILINDDKTINSNITSQFFAYHSLVTDEANHNQIDCYVISKNGEKVFIPVDSKEVKKLNEDLFEAIQKYNQKNYIFGDADTCSNCDLASFCDNFTEKTFENYSDIRLIRGLITKKIDESNCWILEVESKDEALFGKKITIYVNNKNFFEQLKKLNINEVVTFKNIRFFNETDDKISFKLGDFGKITIKT
tara:strand:+ start:1859 stop:2869 length:1011 start_codon:yes stop_codon:yes gene_type:complete